MYIFECILNNRLHVLLQLFVQVIFTICSYVKSYTTKIDAYMWNRHAVNSDLSSYHEKNDTALFHSIYFFQAADYLLYSL